MLYNICYITSNWRLYNQRGFCYVARCLLYNKKLCYIAHPNLPDVTSVRPFYCQWALRLELWAWEEQFTMLKLNRGLILPALDITVQGSKIRLKRLGFLSKWVLNSIVFKFKLPPNLSPKVNQGPDATRIWLQWPDRYSIALDCSASMNLSLVMSRCTKKLSTGANSDGQKEKAVTSLRVSICPRCQRNFKFDRAWSPHSSSLAVVRPTTRDAGDPDWTLQCLVQAAVTWLRIDTDVTSTRTFSGPARDAKHWYSLRAKKLSTDANGQKGDAVFTSSAKLW